MWTDAIELSTFVTERLMLRTTTNDMHAGFKQYGLFQLVNVVLKLVDDLEYTIYDWRNMSERNFFG